MKMFWQKNEGKGAQSYKFGGYKLSCFKTRKNYLLCNKIMTSKFGNTEPSSLFFLKPCSACGKTLLTTWRMLCSAALNRGWMAGISALAGDTTALRIKNRLNRGWEQDTRNGGTSQREREKKRKDKLTGQTSEKQAPSSAWPTWSLCWWWQ